MQGFRKLAIGWRLVIVIRLVISDCPFSTGKADCHTGEKAPSFGLDLVLILTWTERV